ncbi:MAG: serine/threonine protein kinase [Myxococcaceae bacterium]|nr:MAG: serine/threonine protein kinase [Myxococcaceae bacterium]
MAKDALGLVGTTVEGRYVVRSACAAGGFGVVYRCDDVRGGQIALKVMKVAPDTPPDRHADLITAWTNEVVLFSKARHPNIVKIHDFGVTSLDDRFHPWIALEWLEGRTLKEEMRSDGHASGGRAACLERLRPLFLALEALHGADPPVAHRDVKPQNVMVLADTLKLLDFGLAKGMNVGDAAGTGDTRTVRLGGVAAVTYGYAAPEQLRDKRTGPWTDVYALGLVVTEFLTGRRAYAPPPPDLTDAEKYLHYVGEATSERRPTPRKFDVDVGTWEAILLSAVSLSPKDRPPSAGALLSLLEGGLQAEVPAPTPEPEPAPPPPAPVPDLPPTFGPVEPQPAPFVAPPGPGLLGRRRLAVALAAALVGSGAVGGVIVSNPEQPAEPGPDEARPRDPDPPRDSGPDPQGLPPTPIAQRLDRPDSGAPIIVAPASTSTHSTGSVSHPALHPAGRRPPHAPVVAAAGPAPGVADTPTSPAPPAERPPVAAPNPPDTSSPRPDTPPVRARPYPTLDPSWE